MHSPIEKIVHDLVKETAGKCYYWKVGDIVQHPTEGAVQLTAGYYLDPTYGRVSNFWHYRKVNEDGSLGAEQLHGYGWE